MEAFRAELGEAGTHIKNAGRVLLGKSAKESKKESDKGILAKFKKMFEGMSKGFAEMEKKSKTMLEKLSSAKESVKADLANLKVAKSKEKATLERENER